MKYSGRFFLLCALLAGWIPAAPGQEPVDCRMVSANIHAMIKKAPDHTLTIVEDALVAAPNCVCEIIKTAIVASNADGPLVQKIVYTAVKTTQQAAPVIAECAVAAAPQHADFVRAAFAEAFEDQPRTTGRKPKPQQRPRPSQRKPTPEPEKPVRVAKRPGPTSQPRPVTSGRTRPKPLVATRPSPESGQVAHQGMETVIAQTGSGKQVVELGPSYAYDPKGIVVEPEPREDEEEWDNPYFPDEPYRFPPYITYFGGPPMDMTGLYLVPPVASAPPFVDEPDPEEPRRQVKSSTTSGLTPRPPKPRKPKTPIRSRPISPTGP